MPCGRYWFHAEENLNKVAADREGELTDRAISESIIEELRNAVGRRRDVVVCPQDSTEVPDDGVVRLVVLPPGKSLPSRSSEADEARAATQDIVMRRGDTPRLHRNTLVFLAARNDDVRALRTSIRTSLAWDSIVNGERRIYDLAGERAAQARASLERSRSDTETALVRAWRWALAPSQASPLKGEYTITELATDATITGEIASSAFATLAQEEALVDAISPSALANVLTRYVWPGRGHPPLPRQPVRAAGHADHERLHAAPRQQGCTGRLCPGGDGGVHQGTAFSFLR